jgi:hypothetical protein
MINYFLLGQGNYWVSLCKGELERVHLDFFFLFFFLTVRSFTAKTRQKVHLVFFFFLSFLLLKGRGVEVLSFF